VTEESLNSLDGGGLFPRLQERYGLRANPLEMDNPFFPDAMRHHALETLRHLCGFGDMALLLTGAAGAGKTRILAELVRSESSRLDIHYLPVSAFVSARTLAQTLCALTPSGVPDEDSARDAIYSFFRWSESRVRKGQRMVLLIDDADRVSPELLRLVRDAFLASERAAAAVPVFAGTEKLVSVLNVDGDSTSVHRVHLRPLTREEITAYLEMRVHQAGGKVSELLSPARVARIHSLSQGSFARLKRVTPGVWLDIASSAPAGIGSGRGIRTWGWPLLALLLLGGSWWFVSEQYEETVAEEMNRAAEPGPVRKSISIGPDAPVIADVGGQAETLAEVAELDNPAANAVIPDLPTDEGDLMESVEPEAELAPEASESEAILGAAQEQNMQVVIEPAPEPVAAAEPEPEAELPAEQEAEPVAESAPVAVSESRGVENAPEIVAKPAPVAVPTPVSRPAPAFRPEKPGRFVPVEQMKTRGGWSIQLVAGRLEQTALNVIDQYPALENLRYTRGQRQGKPWFMVFLGPYPSKDAALKAAAGLPEALRKSSPWVRTTENL